LEGEDVDSFGKKLLQAGAGLSSRPPEEIVSSDLKVYEADGMRFAIGQVEVTDLVQLEEHHRELYDATKELRDGRGLDFAMLMVTDVVGGSSRLILADAPPELEDLPYRRESENLLVAEGVVSRKKQLLPVVLSLLED
jgi:manganese-dependent inorganic pyrophosphatase